MLARLPRPLRALLVLLAGALAPLWLASTAAAQGGETLYVVVGGTDPTCANGCGSLQTAVNRAAADEAGGSVDAVVIQVGFGVFNGNVSVPGGVQNLVIAGSGSSTTQLNGNQSGSALTIAAGAGVSVQNLSIVGGAAPAGGGIDNAGALKLAGVFVGGNQATGDWNANQGYGGGVYNSGSLVASGSAFSDNQANAGGGIAAAGYTYLIDDTISANSVPGNGLGGGGVLDSGAQAFLIDDTIVGNQVWPSDLSSTPDLGGGVLSVSSAQVFMTGDTIAGNVANPARGAGLAVDFSAASITGTLMSNAGSNCTSIQGFLTDGGYNFESDDGPGGNCGFALKGDPQLEPLLDNGGQTDTEAIPASSPAYDAIPFSSGLCDGQDQRGVARLQRGATSCDIGAYQVEAPTLYVANPPAQSITAYASSAHDGAAPVLTLSGPSTGLSSPSAVLVGQDGTVYVANRAANSITEYAPEVDGNATPEATIAGTATKLSQPQALALDGAGDLFVADANSKVLKFAAGANGDVAPSAVIAGTSTRLANPRGLFFDPSGNLTVSNAKGRVTVYPPSAHGNAAPLKVLGNGALQGARGVNFDAAGDLLVALQGSNEIAELPPGATSQTAPTVALAGSGSGLSGPTGLDFDTAGNLFVADSADNTITEYSPGFGSGASPASTNAGPATGLSAPSSLSELPPPALVRVRVRAPRRIRLRTLRAHRRFAVTVTARGSGKAFHTQDVLVVLSARLGRRTIAGTRTWFTAAARRRLPLLLSRAGQRALRRGRARTLTVHARIVDDAGTQHDRMRVRLVSRPARHRRHRRH